MIRSEELLITPEMATKFLEKNTCNRGVRIGIVKKLADEMAGGRWHLNGEPIIFDKDGVLRDGQHRLMACIKSGCSFRSMVTRGTTPESADTLGQGARRNASDVLTINGTPQHSRALGAAMSWVNGYLTAVDGPRVDYNEPVKNADVAAFFSEHNGLLDSAEMFSVSHKQKIIHSSILVAFHYLASKLDPEMATSFCQSLLSGEGLTKASPIYLLREKLIADRNSKARLHQYYVFCLVVKAWNAVRTGQRLSVLKFQPFGDKPETPPSIL